MPDPGQSLAIGPLGALTEPLEEVAPAAGAEEDQVLIGFKEWLLLAVVAAGRLVDLVDVVEELAGCPAATATFAVEDAAT